MVLVDSLMFTQSLIKDEVSRDFSKFILFQALSFRSIVLTIIAIKPISIRSDSNEIFSVLCRALLGLFFYPGIDV